jgi:lipopolysaccharide/colanic/teichoic acid biosynthesis glycosyltransferase
MRATANQFFDERGDTVEALDALPADVADLPFIAQALASEAEARLILTFPDGDVAAQDRERDGSVHLRRAIDVGASLVLLAILLPVMMAIAVAIRLSDGGPTVFAHRRIGRGGKPFDCLKFRTMHSGADRDLATILAACPDLEREWLQSQKLLQDPRVTPIGQFLRNTSLDELPQLFNVLRGEMSLVGPRPIVADELARYGRHAKAYMQVKPGLTGLWQVTRNADTSYRRRVATDVVYVRNRSLALDFRIVLATVPAVLIGGGAC